MMFRKMSRLLAAPVTFVGLLALSVSSVRAAVLTFEMTVDPDLESTPMSKVGDGYGDTGAGDFGSPHFAGLQTGVNGPAGTARFVDSGSNGDDAFHLGGAVGGFAIDMSVSAEAATAGGDNRKSMSIRQASGSGRGVRIEPNGGGNAVLLTFVNGTNAVGTASIPHNPSNSTTFHKIRLSLPNDGNVYVYDLENDLDAGPGFNWNLVATIGLGDSGHAGTGPGGITLNTHAGGSTTFSKYSLDYVRIENAVALGATDDLIAGPPPITCLATVTPSGAQSRVGYEFGATPAPPAVTYNINNIGANSINWTASEVNALGAPFDYPWLTLSAANGTVAGGVSDTVNANSNTATLAAGDHTAYVKITDDCPAAPPCLTESFTYGNGALVGNGGWTGTATNSDIFISGNELRIVAGATDVDAQIADLCSADGQGVISVKVKAKGITAGGTTWHLWANDNSGNQFGRWSGTGTTAFGRDHGSNVTPTQNLTGGGVFDTLEMRIHTASDQLEFLFNNVFIGSLAQNPAAGDSVGSIRFQRLDNPSASEIAFDDLEVSVLQQHIRRIDLQVLGCSIEVQEPRIRYVGPCNSSSTTTEIFTIKNNGSADWTHYNGAETEDDDWMTVTFTSSPVARFATTTVTATIDWSQVPITGPGDNQASRIRFGASCDGGSTFVFDTPSVGSGVETVNVADNATAPWKILYNGDVVPSAANSAGTGYTFELFDGGSDQGLVVPDGGVGEASDGFAYRLQDSASSKTKWRSALNGPSAGPDIDSKVGATALARVKVVSATGSVFQYNLAIAGSGIARGYHWGGANNIVKETVSDQSVTIAGDGAYHILRLTSKDTQIPGTGRVVKLYLDENPTPVMTLNNMPSADEGAFDAIAFGTGSTAAEQDIYFDWVTGTNTGAFAPGEEVACIGSLIPASNCNVPKVDVDDDDDVDMDDFAAFQKCYTGSLISPPPLSQQCDCFDADNDNDVDVADFNAFVACETGPNVPWVTSVNCPN